MKDPAPALRAAGLRPLELADATGLQALLERCASYFRAAEGAPPAKHAALERLSDALGDPRTRLFGVAGNPGALRGILQLQLHEPSPDEVTVVLLLLEPAARRRGLGRELVGSVLGALAGAGARSAHLGVQDHEDGAAEFWRAMGFVEDGREEGVTRMVRALEG